LLVRGEACPDPAKTQFVISNKLYRVAQKNGATL